MPELGESVTEGTVTRWLKKVGDAVDVDEPLVEVSTDKVDTEIPSPVAGTLISITAEEDVTVSVGGELARIGTGATTAAPAPAAGTRATGPARTGPARTAGPSPRRSPNPHPRPQAAPEPAPAARGRVRTGGRFEQRSVRHARWCESWPPRTTLISAR